MLINFKKSYLIKILNSNYCKIVFILSMIMIYFFLPRGIFKGILSIIGIIFILLSSMVLTCFVRNIKEKYLSAKLNATSSLGLLATIIGISSLQICGLGAPVCGASIVAGILALIAPGVSLHFLKNHEIIIIIISILIQILALYLMNCFKQFTTCNNKKT